MLMSQYIIIKSYNGKYLSLSQNGKIMFDKYNNKEADTLIMNYIGRYVTLRTKSGKYLSANINGTIDTDKEKIGNNERFEIEWLDDDWFTLKSNYGYYLTIQKDGKLDANQKDIGPNEKFSLIEQKVESLFEFLTYY